MFGLALIPAIFYRVFVSCVALSATREGQGRTGKDRKESKKFLTASSLFPRPFRENTKKEREGE
jgi:hypothetical protein